MKKTIYMLALLALIKGQAGAQNIQEGITHLLADRFKSAESTFKKILAVNPNVIEATYWLGQTYLDMDDNDAARKLYDNALMANGNAPMLLVGRGHVHLVDKKTNEARQMFETALTLSRTRKGDDPTILYMIGRANVDAKSGDLAYAIEKLKLTAERDAKRPEIFLELGNAYRKANPGQGGGEAYSNYMRALEVNPNFVYAHIRIAKLFETQRNWDLYLEHLNTIITKDPNFSLAYYELFYYYFFQKQDYAKAQEIFNKYVASRPNEDQTEHDYLNSQLCWAKKDYDCAIAKAESVKAAMGARVKPRVLKQLAYSYLGKNDFTTAKKYVDEFFDREKDEFVPQDYVLKADIYSGVGVPCDQLFAVFIEGADADTVLQSKINYLNRAADYFKTKECKTEEAKMREVVYKTKTDPSDGEMFNVGLTFYLSQDLDKAIEYFNRYSQKNPDSIYGHLWSAKANYILDSTMEKAVPHYVKTLEISSLDKVRFKSYGVEASGVLAGYYNNIKGDRLSAITYLQKGLEFDSTNVTLKTSLDALMKAEQKQPSQQKTPTKNSGKPTSKAIRAAAKESPVQS